METKSKKRFMNVIMVLLILVIAASGVITVGKIQGWFDTPETTLITSGKIKGVANIERNGIGYTLQSDVAMGSGDIVETKKGAEAELVLLETNKFVLNGNTEAKITECTDTTVNLQISQGEVFGDAVNYDGTLEVAFAENKAMLSGSVFSVSAQAGSSTLNVYLGDVSVVLSDGTQERVEKGEYLSVVNTEDGGITYSIEDLQKNSLSEFLIGQAQGCDSADDLCFTSAELQGVLDDREAEKQAALEASLNAQRIAKEEKEETEESTGDEVTDEDSAANDGEADSADQSTVEEYVSDSGNQDIAQEAAPDINICTISIVCDTILDNMENLDDGKEAYVPANGTILATSSVEFEDGETVFDVLNRVCEYAGIQIEYSWTPMYNSYYIEGINNLYEFDCGNESGWMYKVNGWFPNYGCSSYTLEDGDNIVWCYTCNGLGEDVGGANY